MLDVDFFKPLINSISRITNLHLDICHQGKIVYSSNSEARSDKHSEIIRQLSVQPCSQENFQGDNIQERYDLFTVPLKIQNKTVGFLVAHDTQDDPSGPVITHKAIQMPFSDIVKDVLTNLASIMEERWATQKESEEMAEQLTQNFEVLNLYSRITPQITTLKFSKEIFNNLIHELLDSMGIEIAFSVLPQKPELDVLLTRKVRDDSVKDPIAFINRLIKAIPPDASSIREHYFIVNDSFTVPDYRAMHELPYRFLAVTIQHNEQFFGWLGLVSFNREEIFRLSELRLMISIAEQIAVVIKNMDLYNELGQFVIEVVESLIYAIEAKDIYTRGHSERVCHFSMLMAERMKLSDEEKEALHWASILHDIGKIGIPESILNKTGCLTADEYNIIKMHPRKGFSILEPLHHMIKALPGVLYHHEHYDGTGYPEQLKGEEIPLIARIIAIADTYDAINSDRAYRSGRSPQEAMPIIRSMAGTQFDAEIVKIFTEGMNTDSESGNQAVNHYQNG